LVIVGADQLGLDGRDAAPGLKCDEPERCYGLRASIGMTGLLRGLAPAGTIVVTQRREEVVDERLEVRQANATLGASALDRQGDLLVVGLGHHGGAVFAVSIVSPIVTPPPNVRQRAREARSKRR
jgi:hypothetical protein